MSEENKNEFYNENEAPKSENNFNEINIGDNNTVYFADSEERHESSQAEEAKPKKEKRKVSVKTLVLSVIATLVAAIMLTYSICSAVYQSMYAQVYEDAYNNAMIGGSNNSAQLSELDIIAEIYENEYYGEVDSEKYMEKVIEAYIAQTGDIYAVYYTEEELKAKNDQSVGKSVGVGINIIDSKVVYNGEELLALKVTNLIPDAPAEKAGVLIGDYVIAVITDNGDVRINELGYDAGLDMLLGEEGTFAKFKVLRQKDNGYEEIIFNIERKQITSRSVRSRVSTADPKVGIIQIAKFDYTTPVQFSEEMTRLQNLGCDKFVFDVRYNLGGQVSSVCAVLSYFLNEGDVCIRTKDKQGNIVSETVGVVTEFEGEYAGCNVSKNDIGKYKDINAVVLCNEATASSAELFVATFKDYNIGKVVGMKTFGKGKLQTTYLLDRYALVKYGITDIKGAIKLTTHEYFSAKSDSYDGIGIMPNVEVPENDAMLSINIYDYENYDPIDDQLKTAINILNNK